MKPISQQKRARRLKSGTNRSNKVKKNIDPVNIFNGVQFSAGDPYSEA